MNPSNAILFPVLALAFWTMLVLGLVPLARVRAVQRRDCNVGDFRYGESARVPANVSLPNRNYMNLLELPVLFYVVCIVAFAAGAVSALSVWLAWAFVVGRVIHSIIHLSYNNVMHRLTAFAICNFLLLALLVVTALHLGQK
jgi:hypothetical protein